MYLLYVDESGKPAGKEDDYFVVAGLAIHEQDCYPLARSLATLQRRRLGVADADLELHASHMWSGRSEWARVSVAKRRGLLRAVLKHLATWQTSSGNELCLFGVALHKPSFRGDPRERAHEELFARFDELLTRQHRAGRSQRSLVVADDSSYESVVQTLVPRWMSRGARMGRLHSFVEVPLYVNSKASRLVQAADFVAWAIWQYYENGHTEHIQTLSPRFDQDGGVQHGLTHLVRGYSGCPCVPCTSRRTRTIPDVIPALSESISVAVSR